MSKEEFLTALTNKGLTADYANDGIPTVFVKDACEINEAHRVIKNVVKELGYVESYGITSRSLKTAEAKI